jgi:hypothetical protein
MKSLHTFIIISVLVFSSVLSVFAQTPREIVNQCIATLGGEGGVRNFSNYKTAGELDFSFDWGTYSGKFTMIKKGRKSYLKGEFDISGSAYPILQVFDGKNAWVGHIDDIADKPALNYLSDLDHTPLLLLEKDATFSLGENTEIEGKPVIGIEVTFNNKKTIFFIDRSDHTLKEIRYSDLFYGDSLIKVILRKRIRCLDYKKIDGFMFPSRMIYYQEGKKKMELHSQEIMFDPKVAPDIFTRPQQELDLRYLEEKYD